MTKLSINRHIPEIDKAAYNYQNIKLWPRNKGVSERITKKIVFFDSSLPRNLKFFSKIRVFYLLVIFDWTYLTKIFLKCVTALDV